VIGQSLTDLMYGFGVALEPHNLMFCFLGVLVGNMVGVLPGMGPLATISILLPLTFGMKPVAAILMLGGVMYGAQYGGAICSILLNLPCHPPHAVTCLDGFPMTKQGRGGVALGVTVIASFIGASWGITEMIFLSPLLVRAALQFGPAEVCSLMLLGLLAGSTLARGSPIKGVAMTVLGLFLGSVGTDLETGSERYTFGMTELDDGVELIALALGLFGIAEFMNSVNQVAPINTKYTNVTFKDIAPLDARRAIQTKEVSVLLMVLPLTERYLTLVRNLFRETPNAAPVMIPIDSAGAIADAKGPYESFDIPKGTLRGAPPVPDDDVTTLRVGFFLVANRHLSSTLVSELTKRLMSVRRDLIGEQPLLSGIAAPDLDSDAFIGAHPGAAAFYNGTEESFMDRWSNAIYLTPMVLGALASVFAAAWRFLGVRPSDGAQTTLGALCGLPRRVRNADDENELAAIEEEVDTILHAQLARAADSDDGASETHALIAAAHRLDNLIHHRRMALAARPPSRLEPGPSLQRNLK